MNHPERELSDPPTMQWGRIRQLLARFRAQGVCLGEG